MLRISIVFVVVACAASFAHAKEDETKTLPPVVISATRSPTALDQIASSMTVITADEIARKNKPSVVDLLREVPGLSVANNGGAGQTTRLFMRGTNSNHVLVLMDGVALNDPSDPGDAFDFSNLPADNIERIEVLRGAQSTLYGSQAIGGVIHIISKEGRGAPRYHAFGEYGRYNSSRVGVGSSGVVGNTSYSFQASNAHTDGISSFAKSRGGVEKDGSNIYALAGNLATKLNKALTAKLTLRYGRNRTQFDSPGSQIPRPTDDFAPENDSRQFSGRAAMEWGALDGKWMQEISLGYLTLNRAQITEYYDNLFNVFFGRQQYHGWRQTASWIHRVSLIPDHALTFGVENGSDHFKSLSVGEKDTTNVGLFIDDQWAVLPNLFINAGLRSDLHQTFGRQSTWKIAPLYTVVATGTRLKATYGTGFKAPSLAQLFDTSYGNINLKPEESKGWDAGFEQPFFGGKATLGATWFRNDITNLIGFDPNPPYAGINVGKARTQGVEAMMNFMPSAAWRVETAYTFTQADDRRADKQLARRPKHQGRLAAIYQPAADWDLGAALRYVGGSSDIDYQSPFGRVANKPFATIDLSGNYRMSEQVTLYGRIDNLFDKRYEEVYGYGQPGLAAYGGLKWGF